MGKVNIEADIPQTVNYVATTINVGSTTTLPSGSDATVTNSGTESNAIFNFGIPKGADGADGADGKSAYEQAVEGGYEGTEEEFEAALASDIATVASNISDVNAVGQSISDVNTVSNNLTDISTVATNVTDVNTVAGISSDVTSVASISSAIGTVASHDTEVLLVSDNMASVMTTASNIGDVSAVAGAVSDISTVAGISSDIEAVADNATDISSVAANNTNITAVANNETNINAVNANKTNIDTVATNISSVNTTATNMAAIIAAPTAATNAATSATNAQKWAEGTDSQVTPLGGEHSAKGWANIAKQYAESIGAALKYKGSVSTYSALPSTGQEIGDTWNVLDTGDNYAWTGTEWDKLSGTVDLSAYRTAAAQDLIDATKQDTLVSGTNIKTVNNTSLLGSGDIPIDSLPSQTGQSGKFLTTDGTDASWATISALQNTATFDSSLTILGSPSSQINTINIGKGSSVTSYSSVAIGRSAQGGQNTISIGYEAGIEGSGISSVAIGTSSNAAATESIAIGTGTAIYANATRGIAIGHYSKSTAAYAIQLGYGTNTTANTFSVGLSSSNNYRLLESDGTIPSARLPIATTSAVGGVKVDGSTITINNGVISAAGGGSSAPTLTWYKNNTGTTVTISDTSSANLVKVYKNGILLEPTEDYSISGTTLTLVTALIATDKIAVEVF